MAVTLDQMEDVNEDGSVNIYTGGQKFQQSNQKNVLNKYRSYNYVFTLSSISSANLNDPELWRKSYLENVIVRSSGKDGDDSSYLTANVDTAIDLVNGFNSHSPGRFDMFIDNVEISTLFQYSETTTASLPTNMTFKVFEPYSVNGFLEALHVASVANGYSNYARGMFLLKVEFIGYPDTSDTGFLAEAKNIEEASRFFPIVISNVDLDVSESGCVYTCTALPINESAFGNSNIVKRDLNIAGDTVGEMLENFIDKLNKASQEDGEATHLDSKFVDQYEIKFPSIDAATGKLNFDKGKENNAYKAFMTPLVRKMVVVFDDPQTSQKNTNYQNDPEQIAKFNPLSGKDYFTAQANQSAGPTMTKTITTPSTPEGLKPLPIYNPIDSKTLRQVPAKSRIHEQIASVIRDSLYLPEILEAVSNNEKIDGQEPIDEYGFIQYFIVQTQIEYGKELNPYTLQPKQKIIYIVSPYKVHAYNIPGAIQKGFDFTKYKGILKRTYNYLYTGKNVDVLKFNLNFSSHFFQSIPSGIKNETVPTKTVASPTGDADVTAQGVDVEKVKESKVPTPPVMTVTVNTVPDEGGTGNIRSMNPYQQLSRLFHSALMNNVKSTAHGNLDIIGDPFYLVTGGMGNYDPGSTEKGITTNGEAEFRSGPVCIRLNFRNPIDINGSFLEFDENLVPFSGIFMVNRVTNHFSEGAFWQRIELFRIQGQPDADKIEEEIDAEEIYKSEPNPANDVQTDTTDAVPPLAASDPSVQVKPGLTAKLSSIANAAKTGLTSLANIGAAAANLNAISGNISGVAGAALTNSLNAASTTDASNPALSSITSTGANSSSMVGGVGNKVSNAVTGSFTNVGNTLKNAVVGTVDNVVGTINGEVTAIKGAVTNLKDALTPKKINIEVPKTVDLDAAKQQGIAIDQLDASQLSNIPATVPVNVKAPPAKPDTASLREFAKKGKDAIAKAFGVKKIDNISPDVIPPAEFSKLQSSFPSLPTNPLAGANVNVNMVDATVLTNKLSTVDNIAGGAAGVANNALGSIPTTNTLASASSTPVGNFMNQA